MPRRASSLLLGLLLLLPGAAARAESAIALPMPAVVGKIGANTYDLAGHKVGDAVLAFQKLPDGDYELRGRSGIHDSAQQVVEADLAPIGDSGKLRLLRERSQSTDADGRSLGSLLIDHVHRVATCTPPPGSGEPVVRIPLPAQDHVVNVPLNLLFDPLVRGKVREVHFQLALCHLEGGRLVDATARVAAESPDTEPSGKPGHLVEVRYELDLGPILSRLAAPFLPRLSFWFDESRPGGWIAHRMPLFSKGPTVLVVRHGFTPAGIGAVD
jgi:hypothetical protein